MIWESVHKMIWRCIVSVLSPTVLEKGRKKTFRFNPILTLIGERRGHFDPALYKNVYIFFIYCNSVLN